ncbi:ABC transporter permease [Streptomyces sp. SID3212]|uniref:ABC transporter permease n=1 Tax=Streptomyces sp. SID3212 TaxID=2690259 RepID=UPI0019274C5C|nr:ABC transporter permease [Streptomyces sp. SID3212]
MRTLRRTWRLRSARIALAVLAVVALLAIAGGAVAPHDPLAQSPADMLHGPSAGHPLGTDYLGRDVLSRVLAGTGRSVVGALEAVGAAMLLGIVPGIASVWLGRTVEWTAQRAADTLMIMPFTVFAIAVVGALGNGMHQAMLALGVLFAPLYFRVTRAAALGLKQAQYVEAAELMGASRWWILRVHVWGKILPTVAVTTAQAVGQALLVVASLTFLGLGVQPPAPTWGGMLASDLGYLSQQPWAPLIPGAAIMLTVGALNILADAVRDSGGTSAAERPKRARRLRGPRGAGSGPTSRPTPVNRPEPPARAPAEDPARVQVPASAGAWGSAPEEVPAPDRGSEWGQGWGPERAGAPVEPLGAPQAWSAVRAGVPAEEQVPGRAEVQGRPSAGDRAGGAVRGGDLATGPVPDRVPYRGPELGSESGLELGEGLVLDPPVPSADGGGAGVGVAGGGGGVGRAPDGESYDESRAVLAGDEQREEVERHVSTG